jgi:glycosyltransferase involved in cell wall biosynthesis
VAVRRVLQVIPSVGPLRGGPSQVVRQVAASLAKAGIESHVATTNDNAAGTLDVELGAPVHEDSATYHYFPRQARFYTFSWPLAAWLREHVADYDVVHIHALFSWAALPASHWAYWRGVPYIVRPLGTLNAWGMTERRPWLKAASFRLIEHRIVTHAALMHYTSDQERAEAESLGIRTPSAVIPNPLPAVASVRRVGSSDPTSPDPTAFRRAHPAIGNRPIVLFLSRIDPKKGVDLLLRAFVDVRSRVAGTVLVIAGDRSSPYATEMEALAESLGVQADLVWTGFIGGDEKAALLADADVFVLPSHSENFGIAVAEAMGAGLAVVVSDQVAIAGDVARANAGLVVPRDTQAIADATVRLLEDAEQRAAMGRRGRSLAAASYAEDAVTRQLIDVYNRVVQ